MWGWCQGQSCPWQLQKKKKEIKEACTNMKAFNRPLYDRFKWQIFPRVRQFLSQSTLVVVYTQTRGPADIIWLQFSKLTDFHFYFEKQNKGENKTLTEKSRELRSAALQWHSMLSWQNAIPPAWSHCHKLTPGLQKCCCHLKLMLT